MDATAHDTFPKVFWSANVTELFERAAYYSMASFVVIYLGQLGFGDYWPSNLNGILWTLVYFLPILSGTIADQIGFRRSLLVAFVLLACGYVLMGYPVWSGGASLAPIVGRDFTAPAPVVASVVAGILLIGAGVGHQAVRVRHGPEDGRRAGDPRVRDLLHGDQHRVALRPRDGLRRAARVRGRHDPRGRRRVRRRGRRPRLPRQQGDGGEGAGARRAHDAAVRRRGRCRDRRDRGHRGRQHAGRDGGQPLVHLRRGRVRLGRGLLRRDDLLQGPARGGRHARQGPAVHRADPPRHGAGAAERPLHAVPHPDERVLLRLQPGLQRAAALREARRRAEPGHGPVHRRQPVRHRLPAARSSPSTSAR